MNKERLMQVIRAPIVSEKTALVQEKSNQFVFEVAADATKGDVKAAVEALFNVKVEGVNVVNVRGKSRAFRGRLGKRADWRKAYVRLSQGQTIDLTAQA